MNCPVCGRFNPAGAARCTSCGADFRDPDVVAMISTPSAPVVAPAGIAAGALGNDRILGMSGEGMADGSSLRRIAIVGAVCLLVGALVPRSFDDGVTVAAILPLVLAALGLGLALMRPRQVGVVELAALLAVGGLAELAVGITAHGKLAGMATELPLLEWLGIAIAAVGVTIRVLRPTDPRAAWAIAAGGLVFVTGSLLPHDDVAARLPIEFQMLARRAEDLDGSTIGLAWDAIGNGSALFVISAAQLLPVVAIPVAAVLAFRHPTGLWDAPGNALRVLGIGIILWLPLLHAAALFNLIGWPGRDDALRPFMLGRARLMLVSAGAMLWLTAGASALYVVIAKK